MYATFSYDLTTGPAPIEDVRRAIQDVFTGRATCDLLADTFICEVESTSDYLGLVRKLRKAANDVNGQFLFVLTLHNTGAPLRSNASFSSSKANDIIDPEMTNEHAGTRSRLPPAFRDVPRGTGHAAHLERWRPASRAD